MILDRPESEIKLRQGVTAEVVGNCGLAPAGNTSRSAGLAMLAAELPAAKSATEQNKAVVTAKASRVFTNNTVIKSRILAESNRCDGSIAIIMPKRVMGQG